jgi:hypothetical protein
MGDNCGHCGVEVNGRSKEVQIGFMSIPKSRFIRFVVFLMWILSLNFRWKYRGSETIRVADSISILWVGFSMMWHARADDSFLCSMSFL